MYWRPYKESSLVTVNNVHVLVFFLCYNIEKYQAVADIATKSPHCKVIFIRPHSPFQPEPVQFIHATTSVYYEWDASIPSFIICP